MAFLTLSSKHMKLILEAVAGKEQTLERVAGAGFPQTEKEERLTLPSPATNEWEAYSVQQRFPFHNLDERFHKFPAKKLKVSQTDEIQFVKLKLTKETLH